ncbi:MAG TPA: hypothetical protein VHU24_11375 [Solirubrobacterales bacterium]|nr:hypothetical protein [Solirubrobacterales bacterium]
MRWLKHTVSILLLVSAAAVALATGLSNHSDDYGRVPLPQGGMVHLPEGKVTVFYSQLGDSSDPAQQDGQFGFQVVPAGGGSPIPVSSDVGVGVESADAVQSSQTIGDLGAVAKLEVPSSGDYVVSASSNLAPGSSSLEFGTNAGSALLQRWHLLAGLLIAAILITLIPTPRPRRRWDDEGGAPSGWSSDPRAPYAG